MQYSLEEANYETNLNNIDLNHIADTNCGRINHFTIEAAQMNRYLVVFYYITETGARYKSQTTISANSRVEARSIISDLYDTASISYVEPIID
jgi:hypothetical protein